MGIFNKTKTTTLLTNKITNMSIPYLEEHSDKVTGIYLSPYKVGNNKHIEIVVVKEKEGLPMLEQEANINNIRIHISINDINNYSLKESVNQNYRCIKDLKGGYIVYDPKKKLKSRQNKSNKDESITIFSNRDELDVQIVDEVKTKLMTR